MAKRKSADPTFAEARERLDAILDELERDGGDVDLLAARIKEASGLIRVCRERLSAARLEVQQVVAELTAEAEGGAAPSTSGDADRVAEAGAADDEPPPLEPPPDVDDGAAEFGQDDLPF